MKCQAASYGLPRCMVDIPASTDFAYRGLCRRCWLHRMLVQFARALSIEERENARAHPAQLMCCDNCEGATLRQVHHSDIGDTAACTSCGHVWFSPLIFPPDEP